MMRTHFLHQLQTLDRELLEMGALIERAIERACTALMQRDEAAAREALAVERRINAAERQIETLCLRLLLEQQPVAKDLRAISAALKMITDFERIGDQAADICGIVLEMQQPYCKRLEHLPQMADTAREMVKRSVDAFVARDVQLAREVIAMDEEVDALFLSIKEELIELLRQSPESGEQALDLLMIAKYFERIGDHAQNIGEWVEYAITGIHKGEQEEA